ncbi:hypothetical protein BDK51DRAFT_45562 [Blyttiomyces helicus]|uniref:F-box domain-containing protein n=1 Tax=Blyttiomyces helicus TaxID=388810 RepID=A0A4P9WFV6_9FUNG|nr:hypothetical protein BDK51DRAFT_45562 [Blyttiomyces helicus]|eukprot:RKO91544.1 hypothetical protein BDK51DRAFT_45562 [Blyttiomyces helicus]
MSNQDDLPETAQGGSQSASDQAGDEEFDELVDFDDDDHSTTDTDLTNISENFTPAYPNDTYKTIQLCANLISSFLRRTKPEDHDPDLANTSAACTRWLALNPLPKQYTIWDCMMEPAPRLAPVRRKGKGGSRLRKPSQCGAPGLASRTPRLRGARHVRLQSRVPRVGARGESALGAGGCHLGQDVREPDVRQLLFVVPAWQGRERAGAIRLLRFASLDSWPLRRHQCVPFFDKLAGLRGLKLTSLNRLDDVAAAILELVVVDILPRLKTVSPLLTLLDLGRDIYTGIEPTLSDVQLVEITRTITGRDIRFWAPASCLYTNGMTATSLPRLKCFEFSPCLDAGPNIAEPLMHQLASLRPPLPYLSLKKSFLPSEDLFINLLAACPTIEELDLDNFEPISDLTLTALGNHPLLHRLSFTCQFEITTPAIASFIRKRGFKLRFLRIGTAKRVSPLSRLTPR